MDAGGAQKHIGKFSKLDSQGITAWVNNAQVSVLVNEAEQDNIGFLLYATTDDTWSDNYIITARAGFVGQTLNLPIKRRIEQDTDQALGNFGEVHLWLEFSDTVFSEEARIVVESWGRFIEYIEDAS